MSLHCGHCGSEVTQGFRVCAGCGAHYRRNLKLKTLGATLFVALIAGVVIEESLLGGIIVLCIAGFILYDASRKKWYRNNA
ncbi:hypothetical protein [uncultured Sulfitobacter sp.]|uniref:hypothetical protein n=1 Tax=uncultured Sulfitobacter sp. TaxID=191468 RepID=UPI00261C29F5|nr:hypothetical protein [uncultured Sulfitobacter sp.]